MWTQDFAKLKVISIGGGTNFNKWFRTLFIWSPIYLEGKYIYLNESKQ